ncbi:VOC family protein [Listeria costaricensis]|uniref:VOC family protein n=1 Tax=Listeria costaricensis TaxID=2026604 RepID=UPI000C08A501|nr:glyoxalase/bleomycin resistance/extradiol dioxygenase family protein [Listeria costaricensis]
MANLYPYLAFERAKEALAYYEKVFGATNITRVPVTEEQAKQFGLPAEELDNLTMHAGFTILGTELFCADSFGNQIAPSRQISLMLDVNSEDAAAAKEADDFFENVAASPDVDVTMPFEEQFWGGKMGQFTDKYGITWMIHSQPYSKLGK